MLLSGYVFYYSCTRRNLLHIIVARISNIMIPLLIWSIILCIISLRHGIPDSLAECIFEYLNSISALWFLWAVLFCSVVVGIVYKVLKWDSAKWILLPAGLSLLCLPNHDVCLFMYPFFVLGFFINRDRLLTRIVNRRMWILIILWIILLLFHRKRDYIYTSGLSLLKSEYGFGIQLMIDIYRYIIGAVGSIAVLFILYIFWGYMKNFRILNIYNKIVHFGTQTLGIYVLQRLFLEHLTARIAKRFMQKIGFNFLTANVLLFDIVITPVCGLIWLMILSFLIDQIQKVRILRIMLLGHKN